MIITKKEIQLLLNEFCLAGRNEVNVVFPPFGEIYTITLDEKPTVKILETYVFSWGKALGDDNERLQNFLKEKFKADWVKNARIRKINGGETILISSDQKRIEIRLDRGKKKAIVTTSNGRTYELKVKEEKGELNTYLGYYEIYSDYLRERNPDPEIIEEIPDSSDYTMVFQGSGVLPPENYGEFKDTLKRELNRDLMKGDKPLYLGFDTNALRHRLPVLLPDDIKCGYCLYRGVQDELYPKWDEKINKTKANMLMQQLGKDFNFFNQPPLEARKHKIGAVEYRKLKERRYAEEISGEPGDFNIIEGYSGFEENRGVHLLIFSEDSNFVERARDKKIKALHIRQAKELPPILSYTWENVLELIYLTAVIYGVVKMRGVMIRGVWTGKKGDDWNSESLEVSFENKELEKKMERDLRITRMPS